MLKLKDDIDLKELEKFGFKIAGESFIYISKIIADYCARITICKGEDGVFIDRQILLDYYPISISAERLDKAISEYEYTLFDLIQAGLVEKVEE